MARLAAYVHVTDERGRSHVFGPADEVPAWAAQCITNPAAWAEPPVPEPAAPAVEVPAPAPTRAAPRRRKAAVTDADAVRTE